jgi:hypothetical protein
VHGPDVFLGNHDVVGEAAVAVDADDRVSLAMWALPVRLL